MDSVSASQIPYCAFGTESAIGCLEDVEEEVSHLSFLFSMGYILKKRINYFVFLGMQWPC